MNRIRLGNGLYHIGRWSLAFLFIVSGATKLIDPVQFAVLIEAYGILPEMLVMPVAILLPILEVVAALGLLYDLPGSLATITLLMVLFMAVLGYGVWLGLDVDCGCFGPEDPEFNAFHGLRQALYRDVAIMVGVAFLYFWRYRQAEQPVRLATIL